MEARARRLVHVERIGLDDHESAIIVEYKVSSGRAEGSQQAASLKSKRIRVKGLQPDCNIPRLAQDIAATCSILCAAHVPSVETALYQLLQRDFSIPGAGNRPSTALGRPQSPWVGGGHAIPSQAGEPLRVEELQACVEGLYEPDLRDRAAAFARISAHLVVGGPATAAAAAAAHPPLAATLAHVAREDARRSAPLAAAAAAAFAALARVGDIRAALSEHGVGLLLLDIVAWELAKRPPSAPDLATSARPPTRGRDGREGTPPRSTTSAGRPHSSASRPSSVTWTPHDTPEQHDSPGSRPRTATPNPTDGSRPGSQGSNPHPNSGMGSRPASAAQPWSGELQGTGGRPGTAGGAHAGGAHPEGFQPAGVQTGGFRADSAFEGRRTILCQGLATLRMMAEDPIIAKKMLGRHITAVLALALDCGDLPDVQLQVLGFLRKLAQTLEGLAEAGEDGIVPRALRLLCMHPKTDTQVLACEGSLPLGFYAPGGAEGPDAPQEIWGKIRVSALGLLNALAVDGVLRQIMMMEGAVQSTLDILEDKSCQAGAVALLEQLSRDEPSLVGFVGSGVVGKVVQALTLAPNLRAEPQLVALAANLIMSPSTLEELFAEGFLEVIFRVSQDTGDALPLRMARTAAEQCHPGLMHAFEPHLEGLVTYLSETSNEEALIEGLACLAALELPTCDWSSILQASSLLPKLYTYLQGNDKDDEVTLQALQLIGALCGRGASSLITDAELPSAVLGCMADHREDDEFVLVGTLVLHEMLLQEPTCSTLLNETEALHYLVDLLQDDNPEVMEAADAALDTLLEAGGPAEEAVQTLKFQAYNAEWLNSLEGQKPRIQGHVMQPQIGWEGSQATLLDAANAA